MNSVSPSKMGGYVIAVMTLLAGVGIIIGAASIHAGPAYGSAGPQLFPYLIGMLTVVVGVGALIGAIRDTIVAKVDLKLDLGPPMIMAAGLLIQILTIEQLGWIPSTTALFVAGARSFRKGHMLIDTVVGLAVSTITLLIFDQGLGLHLPLGSWFFE